MDGNFTNDATQKNFRKDRSDLKEYQKIKQRNMFKLKKNFTTLALTLLFCSFNMMDTRAQSPSFEWVKQLGGNAGKSAAAITVDKFGYSYSIGVFDDVVDFDPGPSTFTLANSTGGDYTYILKLDPQGNFVWAKSFTTTTNTFPTDIVADANGDVYILGVFEGTVDFDPSPTNFTVSSVGTLDLFITKLDNSGNFIWTKQVGGANAELETYQTLEIDEFNNLYFAGSLFGTADFDPAVSTSSLTSIGGYDAFICKFNSAGGLLWAKIVGGSLDDEAYGLDIDAQKNIVIGGNFGSSVDFDPGSGVTSYTALSGYDCFVMKLDSAGVFQWANAFGNSLNFNEAVRGIAIRDNGEIYATGTFSGAVDFDPSSSVSTLTATTIDIFITKIAANGTLIWAKLLTGSGNCQVRGIDVDFLGNVYIIGAFEGTLDCDPSPVPVIITSQFNYGIFLVKLTISGNYGWGRGISGPTTESEQGVSIKIDYNGNIYSTGDFDETLDFDPDAGVAQVINNGTYDVYIHKFSQCLPPLAPSVPTASNSIVVCNGGSTTTLSAFSSGTVSWFSSSSGGSILGTGFNFITPTLALGTYTYYAQANTCTLSLSRSAIVVLVNSSPTISVVSSKSVVCAGESVTLTASGATANTYSWSSNGSMSSIVVNPLTTTTYSVIGSVAGCSGTTAIQQNVSECTDLLKNQAQAFKISVFPNPAHDNIYIEAEGYISLVYVLDATGRIVKTVQTGELQTVSISLTDLPVGLYFTRVFTSGSEQTITFSKY